MARTGTPKALPRRVGMRDHQSCSAIRAGDPDRDGVLCRACARVARGAGWKSLGKLAKFGWLGSCWVIQPTMTLRRSLLTALLAGLLMACGGQAEQMGTAAGGAGGTSTGGHASGGTSASGGYSSG